MTAPQIEADRLQAFVNASCPIFVSPIGDLECRECKNGGSHMMYVKDHKPECPWVCLKAIVEDFFRPKEGA